MKWGRWAAVASLGLVVVVVMIWGSFTMGRGRGLATVRAAQFARPLAMARPVPNQNPVEAKPPAADDPAPVVVVTEMSVGDALLQPFDFPFAEPTTLSEVQQHLAKTLGAPVVLDLAAMDRLKIDAEETVQLDLKAVRLKTGLKLLLDQVGMTFKVVAEDNLLILTDPSEAGEPIDRALRELKALHLEMHDLQDAVDDLRDLVEEDLGVEPAGDPDQAGFVRFQFRRDDHRPRLSGRPSRLRRESPAPQPPPEPKQARPRGGVRG